MTIAHVTPYPWGEHHEVNAFVAGAASELAERGHRVLIAAPGGSRADVRRSQRAIKDARARPAAPFGSGWDGLRAGRGRPARAVDRPGDPAARRGSPAAGARYPST